MADFIQNLLGETGETKTINIAREIVKNSEEFYTHKSAFHSTLFGYRVRFIYRNVEKHVVYILLIGPANFSKCKHATMTPQVQKAIQEMQNNSILWNTKDYRYLSPYRTAVLHVSARRMGVSPQRLNLLVKYIKKEYSRTRKQLEAPGKGNQTNVHWKWYKYCHFLRELKNPPNYSKPAEISNANDSSGNASNRSSQSHQPEEPEHIPIKDEEPDEDDDDDVGSVTKVYIVDTRPQMKPEDQEEDSRESIHHHSDPPGSTHSEDDHAPMDESDKERDSTENSRRQDKSNKEFLIKGVCSSVRYNLSNDKISEDEVIEFHGELLKYMHSYFKNKFK